MPATHGAISRKVRRFPFARLRRDVAIPDGWRANPLEKRKNTKHSNMPPCVILTRCLTQFLNRASPDRRPRFGLCIRGTATRGSMSNIPTNTPTHDDVVPGQACANNHAQIMVVCCLSSLSSAVCDDRSKQWIEFVCVWIEVLEHVPCVRV